MALLIFARMREELVDANIVTYNSILDAVHDWAGAPLIFRLALSSGIYESLLSKHAGGESLDLHDLSTGAARLAIIWWLSDVLPGVLCGRGSAPNLEIITGQGLSRKAWDTTDMKASVCEFLDVVGVRWSPLLNAGRLALDANYLSLVVYGRPP